VIKGFSLLQHGIYRRLSINLTEPVATVMTILSEIGPDLSRFAGVKHFCSWLRLCPATKISGGKTLTSGTQPSANRARQALKMAAMSLSRSDSALGAFYRRLCARMDKPRANTAVAHKLARMVYFMLTRGKPSSIRGSSVTRNSKDSAASRPSGAARLLSASRSPQPHKPLETSGYPNCFS